MHVQLLCSCAMRECLCLLPVRPPGRSTWLYLSVQGIKGATAHQVLQGATAQYLVCKGATAQLNWNFFMGATAHFFMGATAHCFTV